MEAENKQHLLQSWYILSVTKPHFDVIPVLQLQSTDLFSGVERWPRKHNRDLVDFL
jgi:hypothetical protein